MGHDSVTAARRKWFIASAKLTTVIPAEAGIQVTAPLG